MRRWFDAHQPGGPVEGHAGPERRGVGLVLPVRSSDCTGERPSWHPFQVNVCDDDAADPVALTSRERSI
jgi:hypothetical protein